MKNLATLATLSLLILTACPCGAPPPSPAGSESSSESSSSESGDSETGLADMAAEPDPCPYASLDELGSCIVGCLQFQESEYCAYMHCDSVCRHVYHEELAACAGEEQLYNACMAEQYYSLATCALDAMVECGPSCEAVCSACPANLASC